MIKEVLEWVLNYNYCTKEEYNKAMDKVVVRFSEMCADMKKNIDVDGDGRISVREQIKQMKRVFKLVMKMFRSNSEYWK